MKTISQRIFVVFGTVLILLLVILSFSTIQAHAQSDDDTTWEYLLVLPVQLPPFDDVPSGLDEITVRDYAASLLYQQAEQLRPELERMFAEGWISDYEVRPDLHGIVVKSTPQDGNRPISELSGIEAVVSLEKKPSTCATAGADALIEQLLGVSWYKYERAQNLSALAASETDPSIEVYAPPDRDYGYVSGKTKPNIQVFLRIRHGKNIVTTQRTTSSSDGYYYFSPGWHSCPTSGYEWVIRPGDVIEVTAHGNTIHTEVVRVLAWADPTRNMVAGFSSAGRKIEVTVFQSKNDPCKSSSFKKEEPVDRKGEFAINFNGLVDFDRRAFLHILAKDRNGNSTGIYIAPYRVGVSLLDNYFYGTIKPFTEFQAILQKGDISTEFHGISDGLGYFFVWTNTKIQPGDVIRVTGGGVTINYQVVPLNVEMDVRNNRITGTTAPKRLVRASVYKRAWGWDYVRTSCSWDYTCKGGMSGGDSKLQVGLDMNIESGDYGDISVYDREGNSQYTQVNTAAIIADITYNNVKGYWKNPATNSVTITLKASDGHVKEKRDNVWVSSWSKSFSTWMYGSTIVPGDIIEVSDGRFTESMTVQSLSARLESGGNKLVGESRRGKLIADLSDFRRISSWHYGYCKTTDISGHYELRFDNAQIGPQDSGIVWFQGNDGHYTFRQFSSFSVSALEKGNRVWGYTKTPQKTVSITLKRNGRNIESQQITSYNDGYFLVRFDNKTIQPNDVLEVSTGDGERVNYTIPLLTVEKGALHNRLIGIAPANQPVRAGLRRRGKYSWYEWTRSDNANSSGHYEISFDGLYWSRDCSTVNVGQTCIQPVVYYYLPNEHGVWLEGSNPPPVVADSFEPDNNVNGATKYSGIQSHTFDKEDDEDWVAFDVASSDVGRTFRIETFNLGWYEDTVLHLYDRDGSTVIASNDDGGKGRASKIIWKPNTSGTYYVKVIPYNSDYAAYCGATYDLVIMPIRGKLYLPMTMRTRR